MAVTTATAKIVHVRNFPETCSQQQIRDCFASYGEIVECLILHDSYAFVHFKMAQDARLALQSTNNTQFMAQNLLVQYSRSKFKQQNSSATSATSSIQQPPNLMSNMPEEAAYYSNSNPASNGMQQQQQAYGSGGKRSYNYSGELQPSGETNAMQQANNGWSIANNGNNNNNNNSTNMMNASRNSRSLSSNNGKMTSLKYPASQSGKVAPSQTGLGNNNKKKMPK